MRPRLYTSNAERQAAYRKRHFGEKQTLLCWVCQKPFIPSNINHRKYCSSACRQKAYRLRRKRNTWA